MKYNAGEEGTWYLAEGWNSYFSLNFRSCNILSILTNLFRAVCLLRCGIPFLCLFIRSFSFVLRWTPIHKCVSYRIVDLSYYSRTLEAYCPQMSSLGAADIDTYQLYPCFKLTKLVKLVYWFREVRVCYSLMIWLDWRFSWYVLFEWKER